MQNLLMSNSFFASGEAQDLSGGPAIQAEALELAPTELQFSAVLHRQGASTATPLPSAKSQKFFKDEGADPRKLEAPPIVDRMLPALEAPYLGHSLLASPPDQVFSPRFSAPRVGIPEEEGFESRIRPGATVELDPDTVDVKIAVLDQATLTEEAAAVPSGPVTFKDAPNGIPALSAPSLGVAAPGSRGEVALPTTKVNQAIQLGQTIVAEKSAVTLKRAAEHNEARTLIARTNVEATATTIASDAGDPSKSVNTSRISGKAHVPPGEMLSQLAPTDSANSAFETPQRAKGNLPEAGPRPASSRRPTQAVIVAPPFPSSEMPGPQLDRVISGQDSPAEVLRGDIATRHSEAANTALVTLAAPVTVGAPLQHSHSIQRTAGMQGPVPQLRGFRKELADPAIVGGRSDQSREVPPSAVNPHSSSAGSSDEMPVRIRSIPQTAQSDFPILHMQATTAGTTAGHAVDSLTGSAADGRDIAFADVAPALAPSSRSLLVGPTAQLAQNIARQIVEGAVLSEDQPVELTLSPKELGRVRLTLSTTDAGVSVSVLAERPETLEILRRNIGTLAEEFREIGYTEIDFSFNQNDARNSDRDPDSDTPASDRNADQDYGPTPKVDALFVSLNEHEGLDIRL